MPRRAEYDRGALAELLGRQHGVVARAQAYDCGMSHDLVKYRARLGGPWRVLVPGVYLTHTGAPTGKQQDMAALLYAGPRSVLTGPAALRRFGLAVGTQPSGARPATPAIDGGHRVDVLVPKAVQRRDAGFVRLRPTTRLPERICVDGEFRFTLPPRAVADGVRDLGLAEVRAMVAAAVQQGACTVTQLAEELAAGPTRGSATFRRVLAEVGDGVRSVAEAGLRDLIGWAKLPAPLYNPRLFVGTQFLATPDCWWPDFGVAAEVDSREWHFTPRDWEQTLARHARMSAQAIVVLHFTPRQIRLDRTTVAGNIRSALAAGRPIPHIRTLPAR